MAVPAPVKPFKHEINWDTLRKQRLFLAVPMYGGVCVGSFTNSLMGLTRLMVEKKIELRVYFLFNESLITRARNYCCDEFLRSDCTHMMFVDSDISFNPNDILGMLSMASDPDSPYDVLCGPYPKKCISWEKIKLAVDKGFAAKDPNVLDRFVGDYVFNPKQGQANLSILQPVEVLEGGTGFMMIRRKTFDVFKEKFPHYHYRPDHVRTKEFDGSREIMMYFQAEIDQLDFAMEYREGLKKLIDSLEDNTMIDKTEFAKKVTALQADIYERNQQKSKRYLSEDYWFCQRIQDCGLRTWLLPWVRLQHTGSYVFGGSLIDLAALGAPATADPSMLKKG